jgi:hypothetical protein
VTSKRIRWAGYVARIEEITLIQILVRDAKGKGLLEETLT